MSNSNSRVLGAILLAAGAGLLVWGYQLYGAVGNKFARALGGGTSNEAMLALGGGALCVVIGLVVLLRK
jgi:Protein of unknown function (DUF3185)